ncbi:MAG: MBL fold metallo-hydrolase [Anaerolineales bacterium]|nr:MBL fold metallo-hydrolase [Anaerolineales bacterium]
MSVISVQLLGIGALKIESEKGTIFIDAFSPYVNPLPEKADLILITHDDPDHFGSQEVAEAAIRTGAMVVGPPGIAYPLLAQTELPAQQIRIIYPVHLGKPISETINGVHLKVYQTRHFIDWEPPHISYLIKMNGEKIYVTGDSNMLDESDPDLHDLDALVYSLVPKDLSAPGVMAGHIAALRKIKMQYSPQTILPNHLLHCDWTVNPKKLGQAVAEADLDGVEVFTDVKQRLEIFAPV